MDPEFIQGQSSEAFSKQGCAAEGSWLILAGRLRVRM